MRRRFTLALALALVACARAGVRPAPRAENAAAQAAATQAAAAQAGAVDRSRSGALDETFAAGGTLVSDLAQSSGDGEAHAVALQSGGRIVVGGRFGGLAALARYTADGATDKTFAHSGVSLFSRVLSGEDAGLLISSLIVQPDDKILACAVGQGGFLLARYTSDGKFDASFGQGGIVGERGAATVAAVALQRDGKIVVASGGGARSRFELTRYLPTGARDSGFGRNGSVTTPVGKRQSVVNALAVQADGRIVAAGTVYEGGAGRASVASPSKQYVALARYLPDGRADATFGRAGVVFEETDAALGTAAAVALQADGRIVVAGSGDFDDAIRRYRPDGKFETAFGGGARVQTPVRGLTLEGFNALALQADGKIVAAGAARAGASYYFVVARYLPDGRLDEAFGANGATFTEAAGGGGARAVALQADGRIVAAGASRRRFMLARYLP